MVEQRFCKALVGGSIPLSGSIFMNLLIPENGAKIEGERGRENGSFPVAEITNRWVRGSELLHSGE